MKTLKTTAELNKVFTELMTQEDEVLRLQEEELLDEQIEAEFESLEKALKAEQELTRTKAHNAGVYDLIDFNQKLADENSALIARSLPANVWVKVINTKTGDEWAAKSRTPKGALKDTKTRTLQLGMWEDVKLDRI